MPSGFLVVDIAKAVKKVETQDLGYGLNIFKSLYNFFNKTDSELLIDFLHVRGRQETAAQIADIMRYYQSANDKSTDIDAEKIAFIRAVLQTAHQVFDFELPPSNVLATKEGYIQWYKANGFADHIKTVQEYKKLVSDVCNSLGYQSPLYTLFSMPRRDEENNTKYYDLDDSDEVLAKLAELALEDFKKGQGFITTYKYSEWTQRAPFKFNADSDLSKQKSKARKGWMNKILASVSALIGVGEGFAPAKFYLGRLLLVGCTIPFSYAFAGFAFFAAFSVNTLLFHGDSYNSFNNLNPFGKNRLFKDGKGKSLVWSQIARNLFAVACAVFSAAVLAFVSFKFSGLSVIAAGVIGVMTFIGYLGVLSYNVTNVWSMATVKRFFGEYLNELLVQPLKKISKFGLLSKSSAKQLLTFFVNAIAVAAMVFFGIGIIAITSAMFFEALMSIPFLAINVGVLGVKAIIFAAEIALGTFFARNVSKFIDVVRRGVLEFPNTLSNLYNAIKNSLINSPVPQDTAKQINQIRSARVNLGRVLGAILVGFAFVNAGGFAFGYFATAITHSALALVFAPVVGPVILVVAPFIAALNYLFASVGGNASASLAAVSAPIELPAMFERHTAADVVVLNSQDDLAAQQSVASTVSYLKRGYREAAPKRERASSSDSHLSATSASVAMSPSTAPAFAAK